MNHVSAVVGGQLSLEPRLTSSCTPQALRGSAPPPASPDHDSLTGPPDPGSEPPGSRGENELHTSCNLMHGDNLVMSSYLGDVITEDPREHRPLSEVVERATYSSDEN